MSEVPEGMSKEPEATTWYGVLVRCMYSGLAGVIAVCGSCSVVGLRLSRGHRAWALH